MLTAHISVCRLAEGKYNKANTAIDRYINGNV